MNDGDPRRLLAQRLRALREDNWPRRRITQSQLAQALGGVSVPLISSWESSNNPRTPPTARLESYAALFATVRSFDEDPGHVLRPEEMSDEERRTMNELRQELLRLREAAVQAGPAPPEPSRAKKTEESLSSGPWYFPDGNRIVIVCAQWPEDMLAKIPYTDISDPDYIEMLTYSELDALFEVFGHLRAANPTSVVNLRVANAPGEVNPRATGVRLTRDDYHAHLVTLGGIDWNTITSSVLRMLDLPVRQVANWQAEGEQYFEVTENGKLARYRPTLEKVGQKTIIREDVALFARSVSPFNQKRTLTICNGMYGRGTYGAVRALTDEAFRDRNTEYLRSRFGDSDSYCILTRVPIVNGETLTPDWTIDDYKLFEWQG